ncbi:MAG: hypothetical protein WCD86_08610 [Ktedonobacteraceae bacterium]
MNKIVVERHLGDKIAIIGSPGAGKTTLALQLGKILETPAFHLERYFWLPGWKEKPGDVRIKILEELIQQEQWIIEGTYLRSSEPRLQAADTIIFLDISTWLCLKRIFYRRFKDRRRPRPDLPDGCSGNLNLKRILKVLSFRVRHRRALNRKLHNYKSKQVIRLHSGKEVENFLTRLQQGTEEKRIAHILDSAVVALA